MSLQTRIAELITAIGADIKLLKAAPSESASFSKGGTLGVMSGSFRYPIKGGTFEIVSIAAMVGTAPTGSSLIVDVNKNGVTIFTSQSNRPTISAGGNSAAVGSHSTTTVVDGDYLSVDIDQVGSSVPGSDLVVVVRLRRVSA